MEITKQNMKDVDESNHIKSSDRLLVLKPIEGMKPLSSTGMIDPRLFTGENHLHGTMDLQTSLWTLRYDDGALPPALRNQQFTSFSKLKQFVEKYFNTRNITITEVKD